MSSALDAQRSALLRGSIAAGLAELDAGLGVTGSVDQLMPELYAEAGLEEP